MSSELALNAYILLGNALNYVVNGIHLDYEVELAAHQSAVTDVYKAIEPLAPTEILRGVAALAATEKSLLDRCCRYCLRVMNGDEISAKLGLSRSVAEDVLNQLDLETSHA
jgi:hypothetical protein